MQGMQNTQTKGCTYSPTKQSSPNFHVCPESSLLVPFNDSIPAGKENQSLVFPTTGNAFKLPVTNGTSAFSFEGKLQMDLFL